MKTPQPRIAAVVLAAGLSRRMGSTNKLLLSVGGDSAETLVGRAVQTALASKAAPVLVVVGHDAPAIRRIVGDSAVQIVENDAYEAGLGTSLAAGLRALTGAAVDGALVLLADMPQVTPDDLNALIDAFTEDAGTDDADRPICLPVHQGRHGNPALIPVDLFGDLQTLSGDSGAKKVLLAHPERIKEVPASSGVLKDIDTPEDVEKFRD